MSLVELLGEVGVSEEDAYLALREELAEARRSAALSRSAEEFFVAHAGVGRSTRTDEETTAALAGNAVSNMAALVAASITVGEAAEGIGISVSRVRHRLRDRSLYGFKLGQRRRLPMWQFAPDGQPLPRLQSVLRALPPDLHPLAVEGFMTLPNDDLGVGDEATSPATWLVGGGAPDPVVSIAADLDRW